MTQRLRFVLDGDDRLSPVLNGAGDASARLHRRLNDDMGGSGRAVADFVRGAGGRLRDLQGRFVSTADATDVMSRAVVRFTRDADGRLHDLRGRFISVADANRIMAGGLPDSARRLDDLANAAGRADGSVQGLVRGADGRLRDLRGRFVAASGGADDLAGALPRVAAGAGGAAASTGALGGAMSGVAAIAGLSLLPALGALTPMIAGVALAQKTLQLGFAGVGDAMAAAEEGGEEYEEALKKLSPESRAFTKELVGLKKEFSGVGKEIQKVMLPGFTKAVKSAGPVTEILSEHMVDLGGAFGDAAEGLGRMLKDSGFQDDLQANLKLGTQFVRDMTSAMGPFTRSMLDFGAASEPTLTALSGGLSDLLSKGLPGMFDGLKAGIPGTAQMLDGLFDAVNGILPAMGRLSGELAATFGPVFGDAFRVGGGLIAGGMDLVAGAAVALRPVLRDVGFGFKSILDVGRLIGPTLGDIGAGIVGALAPAGKKIDETAGPLQRLNRYINDNKIGILEMARTFGVAALDMVKAGVMAAPPILKAFREMTTGVLNLIEGLIVGAAAAFSPFPGISEKFRDAATEFRGWKNDFVDGMTAAEKKATNFANEALPKLSQGQLELNINNWTQQIAAAKEKLKTVPPSKRADLKATIHDLQEKVRNARGELASLKSRNVTIKANTSSFRATVGGIAGSVVGTAYMNVAYRKVESSLQPKFGATGGLYTGSGFAFRGKGYARGGLVDGPGTGTSDSVFAPWLSAKEFVVNAKQTARHLPLLRAINDGKFGGGSLTGAGGSAGQGLASGMTGSISAVTTAARTMAAAVVTGVKAELQIASPSKKTAALAKDVGAGFISGLTGSQAKIKAVAADLAKDIKAAFSGKKEASLLKYVDQQTDKLLAMAKKRDALASRIAEGKKFAADVAANAKQGAGLANLGMEPEQVTAGGIKAGLAGKLSQIRQFARYIDMLAKKGLHKSLLKQILNMGPEAGYAYASALVGADKVTFKQINSMQEQINNSTSSLGRLGADRLYDAGKNANKGFLAGLIADEKQLESTMTKIAKSMQKAIKNALGIKSPSTVMARLGKHSSEGLARGLLEGLPEVDRAVGAVAAHVSSPSALVPRRPAVVRRGGGMVVYLTVEAPPTSDPHTVARTVRTQLLSLKRELGGGELGIA
ncbi:hypothetical protein [Streptomyces cadmiisoli]|uniref:hypothetical protein n=1 Tax=Streptomyces cadmiisoli TaxID=2184053 RepID=UPI00365F77BA